MAPRSPLQGKTVAVTGAAGFIGRAVSARLTGEGARVLALDLDAQALGGFDAGEEAIEPRVADVTDPQALADALDGADHVVHTAAFVHEGGRMDDFVRVNVGGTANVLDTAERVGATSVVHLSSVVVYGYVNDAEQDESAPLRAYGIPYLDTKAASDRVARRGGAIVIRPGDVYGPGSVPWVVRPLELIRRGVFVLPAPGDGRMLPIYVDDLVHSIVQAIDRGEPGLAYAVWSGEEVTFADYFAGLAEIAGKRPARIVPAALMRGLGNISERMADALGREPDFTANAVTFVDRRGTVSNAAARERLGWEPAVMLADGLSRVGEWARHEGLA